MKALCVHAHFDDFEFVAAGLFELWRRRLKSKFRGRLVVCTDGQAGHHFLSREDTGRIRLQEQQAAVEIGGLELEPLLLPNGQPPREACLQVTTDLLAALWNSIRAFEPDYLFCPPLASDPRAGIHNDHETVAEAVRRIGYMINVPHAFTPEYPADETKSKPCKVPFILTAYDGYMAGENAFDLAIDVEESFEQTCAMTWCHASQIQEWLPWVGRHRMDVPANLKEWTVALRKIFDRRNIEFGLPTGRAIEVYTVTAWGEIPTLDQLKKDFPGIIPEASNLGALQTRLDRWRGE